MQNEGDYDPLEEARSTDWIKRCHTIKVKELEDRILVLEKENQEWEEYCDELEKTPWKKKYDAVKQALGEARDVLVGATLLDDWDGDDE